MCRIEQNHRKDISQNNVGHLCGSNGNRKVRKTRSLPLRETVALKVKIVKKRSKLHVVLQCTSQGDSTTL